MSAHLGNGRSGIAELIQLLRPVTRPADARPAGISSLEEMESRDPNSPAKGGGA